MSKSTQTFKRTGRNVTVSRNDLINATIDKLAEFDSMTSEQRERASDPYSAPINVTVAGGKMVQVPRYIQNAAIVRWRAYKLESRDLSSRDIMTPHTRLERRKRYAGRDPFVMNHSLKGVVGDNDDFAHFDDDISEYNLAVQKASNIRSKMDVGQAFVPDERYGRGGSM